jgi:3-oxoacyl-ACP reductase-like protein
MAKRTVAAKYQDSDMASGIHRRLLSLKLDAKEILYEEDQVSHEQDTANVDSRADVAVKEVSEIPTMPATPLGVPLAPQQRPMLASAPVTAEEVVKAIVAVTLKVPIAKISMDSNTIKYLAAGWFLVLGLHLEP